MQRPEFEVTAITDVRLNSGTKTKEYLVTWKGHSNSTWQPRKNLDNCAASVVNTFEKVRMLGLVQKHSVVCSLIVSSLCSFFKPL